MMLLTGIHLHLSFRVITLAAKGKPPTEEKEFYRFHIQVLPRY